MLGAQPVDYVEAIQRARDDLSPAQVELVRLRLEEEDTQGLPHRERAAFYRRRVEEAHPQLNSALSASLAAYHASMALLEALEGKDV